jgi:hypothetical protein
MIKKAVHILARIVRFILDPRRRWRRYKSGYNNTLPEWREYHNDYDYDN